MRPPSERLKTSLTTGNLWMHILKLLKKPKYAYEINNLLGFKTKKVTVYSVLYRLEWDGYIEKVFEKKGRGPKRKYYKITNKGKSELKKARSILSKLSKKLK
jgi:PadR family transcriptional regulator PadR